MPCGRPAVHTVIARASMPSAHGSVSTAIAASTASRFASGSPMPWNTTPWTRAPRGSRARIDAHLLDDLPRLEVAREAEPAGRAERARERAADLRADAHA